MTMSTFTKEPTASDIFSDPVSYLAELGIEAEVVIEPEPSLPLAA